jgi:hypothetical protein
VGRPLSWLLTAPLALAGLVGGHALGYRLAIPDAHERAHALEASGHAYWAYVPGSLALCLSIVLLALGVRAAAAFRAQPRPAPPSWAFGVLPPLAFALQEHLERLLGGHGAAWTVASERPFQYGLLIQIPFGFAALLVARLLISAADRIGRGLARRSRSFRARTSSRVSRPRRTPVPRIPVAALAYGERGPPTSS